MSSGVGIRRNSGPRLGSGGNGSIEFRNSGLEESCQLGVPFICFFTSLLFSILYYFFGSRPSTNGVGTGFYHIRDTAEWRGSFPVCRIRRKATVRFQTVAGLLSLYEYVRGMIV
jgi:hypothetical protein